MSFVHFIHVDCPARDRLIAPERLERVRETVRKTPGLTRALFYTPAEARDFYTEDGPSPRCALQLYYDRLEVLEAAAAMGSRLQQLADEALWRDLPYARITHQAIYARPYPVIDPACIADGDSLPCAYLVHYPGAAEDFNAWLNHDHPPQIMKGFPRIREIEIYIRAGWRDAMPWHRFDFMQRNWLIFDSRAALEAALNCDIRHRMRADFEAFPPSAARTSTIRC